eukprot:3316694-Prymnesium_polylepis.2
MSPNHAGSSGSWRYVRSTAPTSTALVMRISVPSRTSRKQTRDHARSPSLAMGLSSIRTFHNAIAGNAMWPTKSRAAASQNIIHTWQNRATSHPRAIAVTPCACVQGGARL